MERIHRALRVTVLAGLAACAATAPYRDPGDPVTVDDLAALPAGVAPENARRVVRQCLQRHRRAATDVHRRFSYGFREEGFVQFLHQPADDRGNPARASRVFVDYALVDAASCEIFPDLHAFRETVRVTLRGRLRAWEGRTSPYRPPPDPGAEPWTREREVLELDFPASEADAARRLVEAILALRPAD